ncbi:phospho-sugar glycosidase domain-containing protein [Spiroplasma sp. ChiS]|uniref:phospho-sugar glycosidase domain-containing protein n=1 Tax=Spiroplasma sp. ChiS TaxID=2099885 RepID=UPI003FA6CC1E
MRDNNFNLLTFKVQLDKDITSLEKEILLKHDHYIRGDLSAFIARSTVPRKTYLNDSVPPRDFLHKYFQPGDIVMPNDKYLKYKGEVQIVRKQIKNDGRRNYFGKLPSSDCILLDFIKPWRAFKIIEVK